MIGTMMLVTALTFVTVIAVNFALVRRVRPELPVWTLFAGDQARFLLSDAIERAGERTDRVTMMLLGSYRVTRVLAVVLFVLLGAMVLLENLT